MTTQLPFPTTDAMEWVKAFRETFPDANVDDGTMLAWFANAIEHGRGPEEIDPTQLTPYQRGYVDGFDAPENVKARAALQQPAVQPEGGPE